jgi:two-component system, NarL family, sensor histidine kinase DesK
VSASRDAVRFMGRRMSALPWFSRMHDEAGPPLRWWPMIFTTFSLLIPNGLALRGNATALEWALAGLGVIAFVALSAVAVVSWQRHQPFLWAVLLLIALGIGYTPIVFAGTIFFCLAAHMLPWAVGGDIRKTLIFGVPLVGIVISGHWLLPDYGMRWTHTAIYYALTIAGQTWLVRLCVNLRRLAEISERERIADELHDVLGEALSKITLKAQFAGRLLEQKGDCDRARNEVAAAEQICREALADVRQTIRKYREESRQEQGRATQGHIDVTR